MSDHRRRVLAAEDEGNALPDGYSLIPEGSGWFGYTPDLDYIERTYGLSPNDCLALLDRQAGSCGICRRHPTAVGPLRLDHDHETGEIRGFLCNGCNTGIGLLLEHPEFFESAMGYLSGRSWATRTASATELDATLEFAYTTEEYAKLRSERAARDWREPLRAVYGCFSRGDSNGLDERWARFWKAFESTTAGCRYRDRMLLDAYELWVELGGPSDEFRALDTRAHPIHPKG
jgi:Recombination endonuclease VII